MKTLETCFSSIFIQAFIDAFFVEEEEPHVNRIGTKGIGEIGTVGSAAAIANALYHATGKQISDLPIMIDKLL